MPQSKTGAGTKNGGNLRWVNQAQKKSNAQSNNQPNLKPLSVVLKRKIIKRDQGKCQYVDHSIPRALGGDNHCENLRALCQPHNLLMAEKWLGEEKMSQFTSRG